jgi:hypothetical protein
MILIDFNAKGLGVSFLEALPVGQNIAGVSLCQAMC